MDFPKEILLPQKTIFRKGAVVELAREASEFGPNGQGMIVHGKSLEKSGNKKKILDAFKYTSDIGTFCREGGEPTLNEVSEVIEAARAMKAEWIAGVGGGSALDLAKAAAGLFNAKEKPVFYQEGGILEQRGIPFVAVPTTAGTGSEATINSVIINKEKNVKLSIRDKSFLARKVILDAGLLKGLPAKAMSYAAIDALVQGYESYISKNATWFSESLALKGIDLINRNILTAIEKGTEDDLSALMLGSYFIGIALSSSRLGVIHGVAHILGALYGIPHGLICSVCLIPSININREAMGHKYEVLSGVLGADLSDRVAELLAELNMTSPFKEKKLIEKEHIISEALKSGSTAANPKPIRRVDIEFILDEIF